MSKTNFTEVEKRLIEGLRKMFIQRLLEMADAATRGGKPSEPVEVKPSGEKVIATSREESRKNILRALRRNLDRLMGKEEEWQEKIGISKQEAKRLVEEPEKLTPEDWEKVKSLKEQMESHEKELRQPIEKDANEKIVEAERIKHINKRFNVREGWLPLH